MGNGSSNTAANKNPKRTTKLIQKPPPVYPYAYPSNYMPGPNNYPGYNYNYPADWYGNYGQTGYYPQPPNERVSVKVIIRL